MEYRTLGKTGLKVSVIGYGSSPLGNEFGGREQIINETLPALRRIQETGKARFIGITGLCLEILRDVS